MMKLRGKTTFWLCVKFVILAPICLLLWLEFLPVYTKIVGVTTGEVIRRTMHVPIDAVIVKHTAEAVSPGNKSDGESRFGYGALNTDVALAFRYSNHEPTMEDIGHLVTNVAPFIALILATGGLGIWRRTRILITGVLILFAFHVLTITLRFWEAFTHRALTGPTPLPAAVGFATITLPFLLWIVLAYWDKLTAYFNVDAPASEGERETKDIPPLLERFR